MDGVTASLCLAVTFLVLALLGCAAPELGVTSTPTTAPSVGPTAVGTSEPADTGWQALEPGAELRQVNVATAQGTERLMLVRLAPSAWRFRVLYTPGEGRRVSEWAAAVRPLPQGLAPERPPESPVLVVNGGYFTPEYQALGFLVSEGQAYGVSYGDFAGMFAVLPGGRVQVRWLAAQPYRPGETLVEAVESFPMLVRPGGVLGFPAEADDDRTARRTVVAQDRQGRLLFIVAVRGYLSLHALARWLVESDLDLDAALNLDGGQSTGLYVLAEEAGVQVDSWAPVPSVIVVWRPGGG